MADFISPANSAILGSYFVTDRQTDKFFDKGVCRFFLQVKFATSFLALLAGG